MRIGLALSGGGFRATLYHLGLVRYLRDADLLSQVSHITSVSGGSVLAAHLVLNWDRYSGSSQEFDAASRELLDFIALDVRNRVVRRYPCLAGMSFVSRLLLRRPPRWLSRTGLLEKYYEQNLFGPVCLHQLPAAPEVHLLSTNVGEGGLTSFSRRGLLMQERNHDGTQVIKEYRAGLVKVATAVAASSAFPAFFPPMGLNADDVGASEGEFPTQYFTDGGVYDNLGVRMFHFLSSEIEKSAAFEEFWDAEAAFDAWQGAAAGEGSSPLSRIAEIANLLPDEREKKSEEEPAARLKLRLNHLVRQSHLYRDLELKRRLAESGVTGGVDQQSERSTESVERQNHEMIVEAFRLACGHDCLRTPKDVCDFILASDAGRGFSVHGPAKTPGFLATAIRSSDILMDRVWHLERQNFSHDRRVEFAAVTDLVPFESDPTALHPELQAQVSRIRTDLDRFRDLEISGLVRQGYCVARNVCRSIQPELPMTKVDGPPWDPIEAMGNAKPQQKMRTAGVDGSAITEVARDLQRGARRRVWSGVIDLSDWITWLYLPLVLLILIGFPWWAYRSYRHAHLTADLTRAVVETREDFRKTLQLLEYGTPTNVATTAAEDVDQLAPRLAEAGLDIISDNRITDLRHWAEDHQGGPRRVFVCRHVLVRKMADKSGVAGLRLQSIWDAPNLSVHCENAALSPTVRRRKLTTGNEEEAYAWEVLLDFSDVRLGDTEELVIEMVQELTDESSLSNRDWWHFEVDAQPEVVTSWILLPTEVENIDFSVIRYKNDDPEVIELIEPTRQTKMEQENAIIWSIVHPDPGYTYSSRWSQE